MKCMKNLTSNSAQMYHFCTKAAPIAVAVQKIVWLVNIVQLCLKSSLLYIVILRQQSSERDRQLLARFHLYEQSQTELQHILQFWDRTQSLLLQPMASEGQETRDIMDCPPPSAKKGKKEREKEKGEKEKLKVEAADMKSPAPSQTQVSTDGAEDSEKMLVLEPIPHIWLYMKEKETLSALEIISSMKLPSHEEVEYFNFSLCWFFFSLCKA